MNYSWPGNLRQLSNAIEHAFIKCHGEVLATPCFPAYLTSQIGGTSPGLTLSEQPSDEEKERVLNVLRECRWNRSLAAHRLGMHCTTLWRKMKGWASRQKKLSGVVQRCNIMMQHGLFYNVAVVA